MDKTCLSIVIIGALNWLLIGLFRFDVVAAIFGGQTAIVSRIIKVKNLGNHEFFLRISLDMIGIDENNNEFDANNLIKYDVNTEDWIYNDGWYYVLARYDNCLVLSTSFNAGSKRFVIYQ